VYDTIGSLVAPIKLLFGRMPSKVIAVYEFSEFKKITKINNPDFSGLRSMNPYIINAMIEDGRLTEDEDLTEEPSVDFLLEFLTDKNFIVRREAMIAIAADAQLYQGEKGYQDEKVIDTLIEMLKDKNWKVKRFTVHILGELGDSRAIKPLEELITVTGIRDAVVIDAARKALKKLKREV